MDMEKGWTFFGVIQVAFRSTPADSAALRATSNRFQERSNLLFALCAIDPPEVWCRVGVNRMWRGGRMVSEANASGKARGYADGDTVTWKVKV